MRTATAPLTRSRLGSRDCPGCEHKVYDGTPVTVIEGPETIVVQRRGFGYRREVVTSRRWHTACLEDFKQQNDAYRAQVQQDRIDTARLIGRAAGMTEDQIDALIAGRA